MLLVGSFSSHLFSRSVGPGASDAQRAEAKLDYVLVLIAVPLAAIAADGTLPVNAKAVDKKCCFSSPASPDRKGFPNAQANVSRGTLAAAGTIARRNPFAINLVKYSTSRVMPYLDTGSTFDGDSGRLDNPNMAPAVGNMQHRDAHSQLSSVKVADASQTRAARSGRLDRRWRRQPQLVRRVLSDCRYPGRRHRPVEADDPL